MRKFLFISLLLAISAPFVRAIDCDTTVLFSVRGADSLYMDIYEPFKAHCPGCDKSSCDCGQVQKAPTIIFMFGGGFYMGRRDADTYLKWFRACSRAGFRMISIDYRLGLKEGVPVDISIIPKFNKALHMATEDLVDATAFLLANAAEFGIDSTRIILAGSSAGAITTLQAAYEFSLFKETGKLPKCAQKVSMDYSSLPADFMWSGVMSFAGGLASIGEEIKFASCMPPVLFIHGTTDHIVNYNSFQIFGAGLYGPNYLVKKMAKKDLVYNIWRHEGEIHNMASNFIQTAYAQNLFLRRCVFMGEHFIVDASVQDPDLFRFDPPLNSFKDLRKVSDDLPCNN